MLTPPPPALYIPLHLSHQGQPRRVSRLLGNESDFTRLDKFYTYAEFHNFRRAEGVMDMLAGKVTKVMARRPGGGGGGGSICWQGS